MFQLKYSYFIISLFVSFNLLAQNNKASFLYFEYKGKDACFEEKIDPKTQYCNPILPGFYPDPSIVRVGIDYYMVNSTFEYFPGIIISHSKDLINWEKIGYCANTPEKAQLKNAKHSHGFFAATINYKDGVFYIVVHHQTLGKNFIYTTVNPRGDWQGPVIAEQKGGDPSVFFDDDGKSYFVSSSDSIIISEINLTTGKCISTQKEVWGGTGGRFPEGPHLYKINGFYYLMIAEGGTEYGHMQTIARSKNIWGPYQNCPRNPILTQRDKGVHPIQGAGHADLFADTNGKWWMVCLAYRQVAPFQQFHHLGRETFLAPVEWDSEGWPVVNNNNGLELIMKTDRRVAVKQPELTWKDDFEGDKLGFEWNFLRNQITDFYSLSKRKGWLRLNGQTLTLDSVSSPTFVGRRMEHFTCTSTVLLNFQPQNNGEEAGLTAYKKDFHHYEIAVTKLNGKRMVIVRRTIGKLSALVAQEVVGKGNVQLRISAKPLELRFSFSLNGSPFKELAVGETRYLSTEVAKSYTGLYIAMYATGNGKVSKTPADFDWFEYKPESIKK